MPPRTHRVAASQNGATASHNGATASHTGVAFPRGRLAPASRGRGRPQTRAAGHALRLEATPQRMGRWAQRMLLPWDILEGGTRATCACLEAGCVRRGGRPGWVGAGRPTAERCRRPRKLRRCRDGAVCRQAAPPMPRYAGRTTIRSTCSRSRAQSMRLQALVHIAGGSFAHDCRLCCTWLHDLARGCRL